MLWWWEKGVGGKGWRRRPTTQAHFIFGLWGICAGERWKGMKPDETIEKWCRSGAPTLNIRVWEKHKPYFLFSPAEGRMLSQLLICSGKGSLNLVLICTLAVIELSFILSLLTVKYTFFQSTGHYVASIFSFAIVDSWKNTAAFHNHCAILCVFRTSPFK